MSRTSARTSGLPPTLADVAERAGVSRQTVSNAVNNPDLLRADTLLRVQQAIADLGYLPNRAARNLRTRASHLIGLRIQAAQEGTANATMDRFVHSLVETSREAGYHVLLFTGDPTDPLSGYEDLLRSTAVDAFVVTDTYLGNPQAEWLDGRRAPFVAFGRPWENPGATHAWVDVDGAAGCESATRHLLAKGHEKIAWIGWRKDSRIGEDRRAGWHRAMKEAGLLTSGLASRVEDTVASGREASEVLLDEAAPTAFVCASDTLAMGVLHTLGLRGSRVGDDVAVVGFDDSQVAQVVRPGLSSVRQPLEDVAIEVVTALEGLLGRPRVAQQGVLLTPSLRSEAAPPHVDGVVDLGATAGGGVLGQGLLGGRSGQLDAHHRLQVGGGVEDPAGQHRLALPALRRPELLLDLGGGVLGEAAGEPGAEGRAARVVVDDVRRGAGARDPLELGEARLAAGAEEVGPAGVHHVDAGVGQRQVLGGALEHRDRPVGREPSGTTRGDGAQVGVRLDAGHRGGGAGEAGQVEAGAAAHVEDVAAGPAAELLDHGLDAPVGVEGVVLELVGVGVVPDVGAGPCALGQHRGLLQSRTRPPGVWICTAITPGVPCGATHSTLTSSSGASTGSPSHSLTRSGSPAISRQARA